MRHYFKSVLLAICCASLLLIGSWLPFVGHIPTASAHAFVIGSDPIDGSTISKAPAAVHIFFDAPVASVSQAKVYAFPPGGPANGVLVNAGQSSINAHNPRELDTPLLPASKLSPGGYEVRWTALSLTDGHTTSGLIGFNLGQSSLGFSGVPLLGPSTSNYFPQMSLQGVLAIAWEWLVLLALFFWIGTLVTQYVILPRAAPAALLPQTRKQSLPLQIFCLVAVLAGEIINLILRTTVFTSTAGTGGISLDVLNWFVLHTTYGWLWLGRAGLLALALLLLGWQMYSRRQFQDGSSGPALKISRSGQQFRQLRQQARVEMSPELPTKPASTPLPARSQARVTDAVAAPVSSSARGTTAAPSKITRPVEFSTHTPVRWQMTVELVLAALVLLSVAFSNEITQLAALPISAGVLTWLGMTAQGIWFGCLAYLGLVLLPILPGTDPDRHTDTLVRTLKYALPWLLAAIGVLLVSDLFLSEATIQTPAQFLNDSYGRALLVRGSLVVLMLIFTGYILFYLLPRLQRQAVLLPVVDAELPARRTRQFALERTERTIKRALHTLTGLAAATLLCVALMSFFAPPVVFPNVNYSALANQGAPSGTTPPASQTQQAGGLTATLQVLPARVGVTNTVLLTLNDAQGKGVSNATIKLSINMQIMDMGTANSALQGNSSTYVATFAPRQAFSMAGSWVIQVEIDRAGQPPVHMTFQVLVAQ